MVEQKNQTIRDKKVLQRWVESGMKDDRIVGFKSHQNYSKKHEGLG